MYLNSNQLSNYPCLGRYVFYSTRVDGGCWRDVTGRFTATGQRTMFKNPCLIFTTHTLFISLANHNGSMQNFRWRGKSNGLRLNFDIDRQNVLKHGPRVVVLSFFWHLVTRTRAVNEETPVTTRFYKPLKHLLPSLKSIKIDNHG